MHAENYGAIWKHEWITFASSLTQDGSSLFNIQTNYIIYYTDLTPVAYVLMTINHFIYK